MELPAAIIFVNSDLTDSLKSILVNQLMINETISGVEFDARVVADPNYPVVVHLQKIRILVIRQSFQDQTNRQFADVVIFVKGGLATIEKNNFGPPGLSLPVDRLNIYALLRYNRSSEVVVLPSFPLSTPPNSTPLSTESIHGRESEAEMAETAVEEEIQQDDGIQTNTDEWREFIIDVEGDGGSGSFTE